MYNPFFIVLFYYHKRLVLFTSIIKFFKGNFKNELEKI